MDRHYWLGSGHIGEGLKVNKVVSIEIAAQVFWIDEDAYDVLCKYLEKIKKQLSHDECADDIYKDIELRIAELLFAYSSDEKKAVTMSQLEEVIEQVGFIEGESEEFVIDETIRPKKSFLDPQNKILAGVCAGLANRFRVPAFIIRVVFVALMFLFGLGAALYLIFWFSLGRTDNRSAALEAQGKPPTAKEIASYEPPKENPLTQLQRIIFLPFSLIGTLGSIVGNHFVKRRTGYGLIFKNLLAAAFVFFGFLLTVGIFEFNQSKMFSKPILWILSAAAVYCILLILFVFFREFYFRKPGLKVDKRLKRGIVIPVVMFAGAIGTLHFSHLEHDSRLVEKRFAVTEGQLDITFGNERIEDRYAEYVKYQVKTSDSSDGQVTLFIDYSSSGKNESEVEENIKSIDYFYSFSNNTLHLDKFWRLKEDALNRSQSVRVVIEVPQGIFVNSTRALSVFRDNNRYQYFAQSYYYSRDNTAEHTYVTRGQYLHEFDGEYRNKLSENERDILNQKFCEEFFISESWGCRYNIREELARNDRFDKAFMKDSRNINQIREFLLPDRSLFVANLTEIQKLVDELSIQYPVKSKFQEYVEHLIEVKGVDSVDVAGR